MNLLELNLDLYIEKMRIILFGKKRL